MAALYRFLRILSIIGLFATTTTLPVYSADYPSDDEESTGDFYSSDESDDERMPIGSGGQDEEEEEAEESFSAPNPS